MSDVSSPKASRQSRPRWLDPKLFLGILLVLSSMAIGARVVSTADDKVPVLVAAEDIAQDADLTDEMFDQANVGFEDETNANLYVSATDSIPANARALRDVEAGELMPRNAMTTDPNPGLADIPVPVGSTSIPVPLAKGAKVDVWVVPGGESSAATTEPPTDGVTEAPLPGIRIFTNATVMSLPEGGGFGGSGATGAVTVRTSVEESDLTLVRDAAEDSGDIENDLDDITGFMAEGTVTIVHHVAPASVGE